MNPDSKLPLILGTTLLGAFAAWWIAKAIETNEDEKEGAFAEDEGVMLARTSKGEYVRYPTFAVVFEPNDGGEPEVLGTAHDRDEAEQIADAHRGEEEPVYG